MTIEQQILDRLVPGMTVLIVTPKEYSELLTIASMNNNRAPQPPVKRRARGSLRGRSHGLFSFSYTNGYFEEIEYDHRNPRYLAQLAAWEREQSLPKKLEFYGPFGPVTLEIQK